MNYTKRTQEELQLPPFGTSLDRACFQEAFFLGQGAARLARQAQSGLPWLLWWITQRCQKSRWWDPKSSHGD